MTCTTLKNTLVRTYQVSFVKVSSLQMFKVTLMFSAQNIKFLLMKSLLKKRLLCLFTSRCGKHTNNLQDVESLTDS